MRDIPAPIIVLVALPLWWALVCVVIAHVGGWHELAASYRTDRQPAALTWRFQSGQLRRWMGYRNCLTVGADGSGLYLAVLGLFRAGHSALFVPWEELTATRKKGLFVDSCELRFRSAPGIPLLVIASLAEKLKAEAGGRWPQESAA